MDRYLSVFKNRRVLITGHTGFKGSWLTQVLLEAGADVLGYSLAPNTKPSNFALLGLRDQIEHVEGDVLDEKKFRQVMDDFQPEFVFHLAAQPLVRQSYVDPLKTFSTNIMGTAVVMDSVRSTGSVRVFLCITSDKCYENVEWLWGYRETDQLGGADPYSSSKAAAEIIFSSYDRSFFSKNKTLGVATARAGNVIGGGDWAADRIIPDCIRAISVEKPIAIRNPQSTRPWQHVLEPIRGYLMLAAKLFDDPKTYGGAWNFGPSSDNSLTVLEVAKLLVEGLGRGKIEIAENFGNPYEAHLLQLNCEKAEFHLSWSPRLDVTTTLAMTAGWYKAYFSGIDVKSTTLEQIYEYFTELK